jgi:hypothetical protein
MNDAPLSGQHASEPTPPVPAPPVSGATGWQVSKKVLRDKDGLIVEIAESWAPKL